MSFGIFIIVIGLIVYFLVQKPYNDRKAESSSRAMNIAKKFGQTDVECIEFYGDNTSEYDRVYVLFEGHKYIDPKNRYEILERVYKTDSENEKAKKREKVNLILKALPYGYIGIGGSTYTWETFTKSRDNGTLLELSKYEQEQWEKNKYKYMNHEM